MEPGWLARSLKSARQEIQSWPDAKRKLALASLEFKVKKPVKKRPQPP